MQARDRARFRRLRQRPACLRVDCPALQLHVVFRSSKTSGTPPPWLGWASSVARLPKTKQGGARRTLWEPFDDAVVARVGHVDHALVVERNTFAARYW